MQDKQDSQEAPHHYLQPVEAAAAVPPTPPPEARRGQHRVFDGIVDLILNRAVARPTARHIHSEPLVSSDRNRNSCRVLNPPGTSPSRQVDAVSTA